METNTFLVVPSTSLGQWLQNDFKRIKIEKYGSPNEWQIDHIERLRNVYVRTFKVCKY